MVQAVNPHLPVHLHHHLNLKIKEDGEGRKNKNKEESPEIKRRRDPKRIREKKKNLEVKKIARKSTEAAVGTKRRNINENHDESLHLNY